MSAVEEVPPDVVVIDEADALQVNEDLPAEPESSQQQQAASSFWTALTQNAVVNGSADGKSADAGVLVETTRGNERHNLLLSVRLVLRSLLQVGMASHSRMLPATLPQLIDLLVVLEKILRHGFKPYKTVLQLRTPEQELWLMWDRLGRLQGSDGALADSVRCVNQLNHKDAVCQLRAWLRLALMQKRLADYFEALVNAKPLLEAYYSPWALLRDDHMAAELCGSLIGCRVFDCNLCLKQHDLSQQALNIDLSAYVKLSTEPNELEESNGCDDERKRLLDQNNYLEERNHQLTANLSNLERRLNLLESLRSSSVECSENADGVQMVRPMVSKVDELCTAMESMEKQMHAKQDSISDLQQQLDDVKRINVELYQKLRSVEERLKTRDKSLKETQKCYDRDQVAWKAKSDEAQDKIAQLKTQLNDAVQKYDKLNSGLVTKASELAQLQKELTEQTVLANQRDVQLQSEKRLRQAAELDSKALGQTRQELDELKQRCQRFEGIMADQEATIKDYEHTLEEMGHHMADSKLKLEGLREELTPLAEAQWEDDKAATNCKQCDAEFTLKRRKHHCRNCGGIFCASCSENTMPLPSSSKLVRVCDGCYALLLQRYSAKPAAS